MRDFGKEHIMMTLVSLKTLPLFVTKICYFLCPIYYLTLRSLREGLCCWLYLKGWRKAKHGWEKEDGRRRA